MEEKYMKNFLDATDDFINSKFLVAEYKLQKMLQELANNSDICSLIGECLEQFNRDREFSKAFIQDENGDLKVVMPEEEYKIIALVFCTLMDMDAKKIDLTDFVKRFFGNYKNPFQAFVNLMIVPFRDLIKEAFNYQGEPQTEVKNVNQEPEQREMVQEEQEPERENEEPEEDDDEFIKAQKIAVQIISQLEYGRKDYLNQKAIQICRAIIKTANQKDNDITSALVFALRSCKEKQVKFLVNELSDLFE